MPIYIIRIISAKGVVYIRQHSLINKIILIICVTVCSMCILITAVGSNMIYNATEYGVKTEIQAAARTLKLMCEEYTRDSAPRENTCEIGSIDITPEEFIKITGCIGTSSDVYFTIFRGDTRVFTSVKNPDGSLAVGTKASEEVTEAVLKNNSEYFFQKINVNGRYYIGYYIPVVDQNNIGVGMVFAGKPLDIAQKNATRVTSLFIIISVATLIVSIAVCTLYLRRVTHGMSDIKQYISKIARGDFTAAMRSSTLERADEIGDIGHHAEQLCGNLRDMIERDPLTSLYNRRSCRHKILALESEGTPYTVVIGDIDHFKKINDDHGHSAGDAALISISDMIHKHSERCGGFASRWGGEEFLIIYPDKDTKEVHSLIEDLLIEIRSSEQTVADSGESFRITMTFGISAHNSGETLDDTLRRADRLLYKGKEQGRNRIETD